MVTREDLRADGERLRVLGGAIRSSRAWIVMLFAAQIVLHEALAEPPGSGQARVALRWATAWLAIPPVLSPEEVLTRLASGDDPLLHLDVQVTSSTTDAGHPIRVAGWSAVDPAAQLVSGRVMAVRRHRQATFADISGQGGTVQVRLDHPPDGGTAGPRGPRGARNIRCGDWISVAVSASPTSDAVPVVAWHEHRSNRVPGNWRALRRPDARVLEIQSVVLHTLSTKLHEAGFLQVVTPVLTNSFYGGRSAPFLTATSTDAVTKALRVTSELGLKSVIASGRTRCFEIGPMFRNESQDHRHLNSFTMMECYASDLDVSGMGELLASLIGNCAEAVDGVPPATRTCTADDLIGKHLGVQISKPAGISDLASCLGADIPVTREDRAALIGRALLTAVIPAEPDLLVIDRLPAGGSPLIRDAGDFALRRWFSYRGVFVADVAQEETDFDTVLSTLRDQLLTDRYPVRRDYRNFLRLLAAGVPSMSGTGLGVSPLVAVLAGLQDVRDLLLDQWQ
jgi:elongation factor P--beta-lysine ligase